MFTNLRLRSCMLRPFPAAFVVINNTPKLCSRFYCSRRPEENTQPLNLQPAQRKELGDLEEPSLDIMAKYTTREHPDPLIEKFKQAKSSGEIFKATTSDFKALTDRQLSHTFTALSFTVRKALQDTKSIKTSPEFNNLCINTLKRINRLEVNEALSIIRALTHLEVSPKVTLMSALLQNIRHRLNKLEVTQIIFLDFLLNLMSKYVQDCEIVERKEIPLLEVLKFSAPLMLEVKITNGEIDLEDIEVLTSCLRMAAFRNISPDTINLLMEAIRVRMKEMSDKQCYWTYVAIRRKHLLRSGIFDADLAEVISEHCMSQLAVSEKYKEGALTNFNLVKYNNLKKCDSHQKEIK